MVLVLQLVVIAELTVERLAAGVERLLPDDTGADSGRHWWLFGSEKDLTAGCGDDMARQMLGEENLLVTSGPDM